MVARIVLPGVGPDEWPVLDALSLIQYCVRPALRHTGPEGVDADRDFWWGPMDRDAWQAAVDAIGSLPTFPATGVERVGGHAAGCGCASGAHVYADADGHDDGFGRSGCGDVGGCVASDPDRSVLSAVVAMRDAERERVRAVNEERERSGGNSDAAPYSYWRPCEKEKPALRMVCVATAEPGPGSILMDDGRFAPAVVFSLGPSFEPESYLPCWKRSCTFAVSVEHGEDVERTFALLDGMFDGHRDAYPELGFAPHGVNATWDDCLMRDADSIARAFSRSVPPSTMRIDTEASLRRVEGLVSAGGRARELNDAILTGTGTGMAFGTLIDILDLPYARNATLTELTGLIADSTGGDVTAMTVSTFYQLGRKRVSRADEELERRMGGSNYRIQLKREYLGVTRRLIADDLPAPTDGGERLVTRRLLLARMGVANIIAQLILDDAMTINDARRVTKRIYRRLTPARTGITGRDGDMPMEMFTTDVLDGLHADNDWKRLRRLVSKTEAGYRNDIAPRPWRENATGGLPVQ